MRLRLAASLAALAAALAAPAVAMPVTFDFDAMAYRGSSSPGPNSAVQNYLQGVWSGAGLAGNVAVTGAGQLSNNQYTGDGHVVGPAACTQFNRLGICTHWQVTPLTLGTTEGGVQDQAVRESPVPNADQPDNYIVNSGSDRIVITFPTPVYSVSFDFEIFPDGTCPNLLQCGGLGFTHWPDFGFLAGNAPDSLMPAMPTQYGALPGLPGTYAHSPASGGFLPEFAPQYLGVSGDIYFAPGVTTLAFVDWPQRIGIDNLVVDTQCRWDCPIPDVPEPPMLPLVAGALLLLGWAMRRVAAAPRRD